MAMPTATSAPAIRMGLRNRTPMAFRRAIRCGVRARPLELRASRCFRGHSRDKFALIESTNKRGAPAQWGAAFFYPLTLPIWITSPNKKTRRPIEPGHRVILFGDEIQLGR